jgi:DNA-binding NarL/FixJ family response regulator
MLTTFDSDDLVLGALHAGALGFVLKDTPPARIADAVRARRSTRETARRQLSTLTERELDTARAIADGLGNAEIAERLHISVATVKAHTGNLFTKLALENRVQIALLVRDAEA